MFLQYLSFWQTKFCFLHYLIYMFENAIACSRISLQVPYAWLIDSLCEMELWLTFKQDHLQKLLLIMYGWYTNCTIPRLICIYYISRVNFCKMQLITLSNLLNFPFNIYFGNFLYYIQDKVALVDSRSPSVSRTNSKTLSHNFVRKCWPHVHYSDTGERFLTL